MKLYILCGLPFSGKTTLAKKIAEYTKSELVAFDKLWQQFKKDSLTSINGDEGWRLTRNFAKKRVSRILRNNRSVVYDDINVRFEHREELRNIAKEYGATSIVLYLKTPVDVRTERMKNNLVEKKRHDVESKNIKKALTQFEEPKSDENVIVFSPSDNLNKWLKRLDTMI